MNPQELGRKWAEAAGPVPDDVVPKHDRFEVENIETRENYTLVLDRKNNVVSLYNTSRGAGNRLMETFGPEGFHLRAATAVDYYYNMFRKSLQSSDLCFLGYVDEDFEPIEEEE